MSRLDLLAHYEGEYAELFDQNSEAVRRLYHHGRRWPEGAWVAVDRGKPGENLWKHAEQFLDYLDTAAEGGDQSPQAKRLRLTQQRYLDTLLPADFLRARARRLVAAECCAFLDGVDVASERWALYRTWASSLGRDDVVITFNYDRTIEMTNPQHAKVIVPGTESLGEAVDSKSALIVKPHGSVDWRSTPQGVEATNDPHFALACPDGEAGHRDSGPGEAPPFDKQGVAQLWELAMGQIEEADCVVLVGYRFPPTDSLARERIPRAIGLNRQPHFRCHVVLGQSTADEQRVRRLVRQWHLGLRSALHRARRCCHLSAGSWDRKPLGSTRESARGRQPPSAAPPTT